MQAKLAVDVQPHVAFFLAKTKLLTRCSIYTPLDPIDETFHDLEADYIGSEELWLCTSGLHLVQTSKPVEADVCFTSRPCIAIGWRSRNSEPRSP